MLLALPLEALAAITGYEEHLLNTQQQLPVSAIHSIYRDREGYLWYGTVNGLCRDDGYNLQIFRPDFLQAQDKVVGAMVEDDHQHLWLGADNGLFWLDKRDYTIRALCPEHWEGERISAIVPAERGRFWLQARSHVALVDSLGQPLAKYYKRDEAGQPILILSMVVVDGEVYASFIDYTLARLDQANRLWENIVTPDPAHEVTFLARDTRQGGLWVLFDYGKIYHAYAEDGGLEFMPFACDRSMENYCYSLTQSPYDGILWVMNTYGVCGYLPTEDYQLRQVYTSMEETPHYHMLANMLCDSLFTLISAFDRPSFMLRPDQNQFRHYALPGLEKRFSFSSTVMDLEDAGDGWWWVFQERIGLCLVDRKSDRVVLWSDCPQVRPYSLDKGRIIVSSSRGVWVNHDDRMIVYRVERIGSQMLVNASIDLRSICQSGEIVSAIFEDDLHRLWIGTNMGLYLYQINPLQQLVKYADFGYISQITADAQGHFWVSTLDGKLAEFVQPDSYTLHLETEPLSTFCFAPDGAMWLGCQSGHLYKYNTRIREVEDNSEACGMNGDRVNCVLADRYGHLWIETNQRIVEYNPRNRASHIFVTSDAQMPMGRFLPTAHMTDSEGRIYFGGIPGVICFEPNNHLDYESQAVTTYITDVHVMKRSLLFGDGKKSWCGEIELQSDDRDLEIFFSSLDHYDAAHVRYAYRLVGVDSDWKYTVGGQNSAFYNQLAKGHYTFEVKATDVNGLWSDHVAQLRIHRLPAFYESTLAYCIYVALLLLVLGVLIFSVHRQDKKQNERLWSDSREMLRIRNYLQDKQPGDESDRLPESEYRQLDQAFVQNVTKAIQENFEETDFGVEELAAAVNVSKSTLSRKLKSITGQSPLDFIRHLKMRQACLWLQDKDRNVSEIAMALGYNDRKYFTACFKKEFGQTPTDYRREVTDENAREDV